jgi:alpha-ketoglutarate-dependent taurine dioxygenase
LTIQSDPDAEQPYVRLDAEPNETLATVDRTQIRALYKQHGAILLKGFASDLEDFGAFAADFCPVAVYNESRNRARLGTARDIQSVNLGIQPFPLHPELSREPWKPDGCFFYCITPPQSGGATTICDGVAIVRDLPPDLKVAMQTRRLRYVAPAEPQILQYWLGSDKPDRLADLPLGCPYEFERLGNQIVRTFSRPMLHKPMFSEELAFGNFILFARFLRGIRNFPLLEDGTPVPEDWMQAVKAVSDRLTVPIIWERGDLLMLDNTRFMHGRTAVTDADNRLIATYFGYLDFAVPDVEEPPNAVWRRPGFRPPPTGLSRGAR